MKFSGVNANGKSSCHPWDGPCEAGRKCSSRCKRFHKLLTRRARRIWNKKKIDEDVEL